MVLLALDAALGPASAAVIVAGRVLSLEVDPAGAARLGVLAERALGVAGVAGSELTAVAASIGPGSFTGIRTALALATGIGLAAGRAVMGVSVGEALAAVLPDPAPRTLWVAIDSRRGRIFLERGGRAAAFDLAALPFPAGPILLAGDAALSVAARLREAGADIALAATLTADAGAVGLAGQVRLAGAQPVRPALPLYIDPPAARLPEGIRPEPR